MTAALALAAAGGWWPEEIGALAGAALMAASFVASLVTAAFGLGGGVMMIAVLASVLPPAALIPVHGVVQLGSNAGRALIMRHHIDWKVWAVFMAGSVLGVAMGGAIVVDLPPEAIQISVGLVILWTVRFKPPAFLRRSAWLAGAVSSVLTMFFGATGPFAAAYLKTLGYQRMTLVAMQGACMTAQHLLKVVAFGLLGFAFGPYALLIAGLVAAGFLGTLTGKRVLLKIDEALFARVLTAILIVLALRLIVVGLADLV